MKSRTLILITATILLAALATPTWLSAQNNPADSNNKHHHYKLIDMGTFGGPRIYVNIPDSYAPVLNNWGTTAGFADTDTPDPYPDFCFNEDCFVSHAFRSRNGDLTDLGVLPGGASSASSWISPNGLIAGVSQNGEIDPLVSGFPELRAVVWKHGKIHDLGTLPEGGYESLANAVNSSGLVVGVATNTNPDPNSIFGLGYETHAFQWDVEKGMQDLGTLPGGSDAEALLVNHRGQIVGASYTSSAPSPYCAQNLGLSLTTGAFLWEKGHMKDLGNFGGGCTFPADLNNRGQVVGLSTLKGDQKQHPFLWDQGKLIDLKTFGGSRGSAVAINDEGQIAGWASEHGDQANHAFLWRDGRKTDLGTVDGDPCSYGFGINSKGQVVGTSAGISPFTTTRAFLWENGGPMVDLNTLIPSGSDLQLTNGDVINDRGEIVSEAVLRDGNQHVALLIPCDENHPDVEGCDYSWVEVVGSATAANGVDSETVTQGPTASAPGLPTLKPPANLLRPLSRRGLTVSPKQFGTRTGTLPIAETNGSPQTASPDNTGPATKRALAITSGAPPTGIVGTTYGGTHRLRQNQ